MRIAETATTRMQQIVQRTATAPARQVSDVSREERLQLLMAKQPAGRSGAETGTYSERAQLLAVSGTPRQSWVV